MQIEESRYTNLNLIIREVILEMDFPLVTRPNLFPLSPYGFRLVSKNSDVRRIVEDQRPVADQAAHKHIARHLSVQLLLFLRSMAAFVRKKRIQQRKNPAVHKNARVDRVADNPRGGFCGRGAAVYDVPNEVVGCGRGDIGKESVGSFK